MANVERDNNMMNEEQESSQSNSSNGSGANSQQQNQQSAGFQLKSSILRQPATFGSGAGAGGGLFGSGSSAAAGGFNLKPSVLKPSHFGGSAFQNSSGGGGSNSFGSNPFLKTQTSEEEAPEQQRQAESSTDGTGKAEKDDPLGTLNRPTMPKSNLFANVKSISENTGFVFGQNVHERVTGAGENLDSSATPTAGLSFSSTVASTTNNSNDSSSSNSTNATPTASQQCGAGAGSAAAAAGSNGDKPAGESTAAEESLEEAARKYEESRGALKRKFDEVETITGEEDERNVAEINCKLFAFAKSNWEERGHGTLRLNDKDGSSSKESRVVFRQAGNLRVLINTKVWSGMIADQSSQKSLRLTAMDNNGQVKVFLVMSRPDVIGKLHKELTKRIQTAKELAAASGENDDDAGKENNNDDDHVSSAAAAKPSEDDDHNTPHATPPVVVVLEKDTSGDGATGEDEPPSAKKRLSASAASP